jgi:hypothetical protein
MLTPGLSLAWMLIWLAPVPGFGFLREWGEEHPGWAVAVIMIGICCIALLCGWHGHGGEPLPSGDPRVDG